MLKDIRIEKVSPSQAKELQAIGKQTFLESFASYNTKEDMERYLEDSFNIKKVLNDLRNPKSESYFALFDQKIIGYLKLNFGAAQTELCDQNGVEIERIYLLKQFQGKKIGQNLLKKTSEIAKQRKAEFIWLGVWEENLRAIQFYENNGFVQFDKHVFYLGDDKQIDIMMKIKM